MPLPQLFDMLAHEDDYLVEAIEAARAEIFRRNIDGEITAKLEANAHERARQERLLETTEKNPWVLSHFFWHVAIGLTAVILTWFRDLLFG